MDPTFYRNRLRKIWARNEVNLEIRRGDSTIAAQPMRIEAVGSRAFNLQSDAARSAAQAVFIMGEHDMNIEREDRLTYQGDLIKVVFIQSNRIGATIAEGIIEQ